MTTFLLILIAVMVLVTMICSIITTVIEVKDKKEGILVKKVLKVVAIVLIVLSVIGAAVGVSYIKDDENTNYGEKLTLETAGFKNISIDKYLELIKKPEKNIILVARPTCGYCEQFTPVLKQAMGDMKLTINYINTDEFSQDDWTKFTNSLPYLKEEWGTPLVLITQNGELVEKSEGYTELDTIKTFFKNNGFGE